MPEITYSSIEHLIQDVTTTGHQVQCSFYHLNGELISSNASIPHNNSTMNRVTRVVKNQMINRARATASQSIFSLLGGGILGRAGSTIIRASVPANSSFSFEPSQDDINDAVVKAFEKVSTRYRYDENSGNWTPTDSPNSRSGIPTSKHNSPAKEVKNRPEPHKEPGLNRLEKEVLARVLVEICDADGNLSGEEAEFLNKILPKELGNVEKIRNMDYISPLELKALSENAKKQIVKCAFILSYSDLQPHETETGIIQEYATQMGLSSQVLRQMEKEAQKELVMTMIDENTTRAEVYEIGRQINLSDEESEMILIHKKESM
ncbi:MAG TPA: hypothetical protein PLC76_01015 [Saprospiraceae bacterium]|nr:hypothetical protein [Saprospiraceae bacterium]HRP83273.1 hypothetical protein [Saprospiraceae bacterium]